MGLLALLIKEISTVKCWRLKTKPMAFGGHLLYKQIISFKTF